MAKEIREQKVEVVVDGRIVRVMSHMVSDISKFGASEPRKIVKEPPKELMLPLRKLTLEKSEMPKEELPKKLLLPKTELTEFPKEPVIPVEPLNVPPEIIPIVPIKAEKTEIPRKVKKATKKARK
jgi:hypothetical protein